MRKKRNLVQWCAVCLKSFIHKRGCTGRQCCSRECGFELQRRIFKERREVRKKEQVKKVKFVGYLKHCLKHDFVWWARSVEQQCYRCKHAEARVSEYRAGRDPSSQQCKSCGMQFSWHRLKKLCDKCRIEKDRASRNARNRARERNVKGSIDLLKLGERDGWRCGICGKKVTKVRGNKPTSPSVGHLIAICNGGTNTWSNVQLEHRGCNCGLGIKNHGQLRLELCG